MALTMVLLVRRLNIFPTAMGLKPPSFLLAAWSLAPQRKGETVEGIEPLAMTFTTLVSCVSALPDLFGGAPLRATVRCSGRKPEGPAALPLLKLLAASETC